MFSNPQVIFTMYGEYEVQQVNTHGTRQNVENIPRGKVTPSLPGVEYQE